MSPLDALAADQRAVLQLVLKQGRSYDDLASLLRIERGAVRDRARGGLEALGPDAGRRLSPERRGEITDYLLGQQSTEEREATRALLSESAGARAWARVVSGELAPVARAPLPEVPADGPELEVPGAAEPLPPTVGEPAAAEDPAPPAVLAPPVAPAEDAPAPDAAPPLGPDVAAEPGPAPSPPPPPSAAPAPAAAAPDAPSPLAEQRPGEASGDLAAGSPAPPSSRLGGLLLLGGLGILVVVAVIVLVSGGNDSLSPPVASRPATISTPAPTGPATSTPGQTGPAPAAPVPRQQVNFTPTAAAGKARGNAILFSQAGQTRMLVQAAPLPPSARGTFYAVWLYSGPRPGQAQVLGFQRVGSDGRLSAVAPTPANVTSFAQVLITREKPTKSNQAPTKPGEVFMQGPIKKP